MAPHGEGGEDQAFVYAFQACHSALMPAFDDSLVDDEEAQQALATVRRLLETERPGVAVSAVYGRLDAYARSLTVAEREEFASAVDVLATYFDRQVFCARLPPE